MQASIGCIALAYTADSEFEMGERQCVRGIKPSRMRWRQKWTAASSLDHGRGGKLRDSGTGWGRMTEEEGEEEGKVHSRIYVWEMLPEGLKNTYPSFCRKPISHGGRYKYQENCNQEMEIRAPPVPRNHRVCVTPHDKGGLNRTRFVR